MTYFLIINFRAIRNVLPRNSLANKIFCVINLPLELNWFTLILSKVSTNF